MNKYILGIDGMRCGMCEVHVEESISRAIKVKRVKASHLKNEVVVIIDQNLTIEDFKKILDPTGYRVNSFKIEEAKKTLFGWR